MMTILIALGNKLGIGQDKDVSRSSMPFLPRLVRSFWLFSLVNISHTENFTLVFFSFSSQLYTACVMFVYC